MTDIANHPPFATAGGQPITPSSSTPSFLAGDIPKSRSQSEAKPEVVPSDGEIPSGGKVLKADPTGPSGNPKDGAQSGVNPSSLPYKNLK